MILYDLGEKILPRFPDPPAPVVVLSPTMYRYKSAYRIDPLLAETVVVIEPVSHPRSRREIYADQFKEY
jgi:hypothetical protein